MAGGPLVFPVPDLTRAPREWPGIVLYPSTVLLEAEGEPFQGKLAVAWVIRNRMDQRRQGIHDVILARGQFSCWLEDYAGMRRARLTGIHPSVWHDCWRAASGAFFGDLDDPTDGATHYLNPTLTRELRPDHDLPGWYDPGLVTVAIGGHEFLRGVA